jgi:hypothetical protein
VGFLEKKAKSDLDMGDFHSTMGGVTATVERELPNE